MKHLNKANLGKIAAAQKKVDAAKKAAKAAKAAHREAKKTYKEARRTHKSAKRELKLLKADLTAPADSSRTAPKPAGKKKAQKGAPALPVSAAGSDQSGDTGVPSAA